MVGVVNGHVDIEPMNASILIRLTTPFPSKDTGIGALATHEANGSVKCVFKKQARQQSAMKRKRYTNFSDTDRAEIGQCAAIIVVKIEGGAKMGTAHSQR